MDDKDYSTVREQDLGQRIALELNTIILELQYTNKVLNKIAKDTENSYYKTDNISIQADENARNQAHQFQEFFNRYQIDMREIRGSLWWLPFILITNTAILAYSVFW